MLEKYHSIIGEEEVGGGIDEDPTAVEGRNVDTAGVAGATSCIPNDLLYGRLETESSGEIAPAFLQAT